MTLPINAKDQRWPMFNDPAFAPKVTNPAFEKATGPVILIDGAHHNFFVQWGYLDPFIALAKADGFQVVISNKPFSDKGLQGVDVVMIITALPFNFTEKNSVTTEQTFTKGELDALEAWVAKGGALLAFSEHAPFDQAINPLLARFNTHSSVGYIEDTNPAYYAHKASWLRFSAANGLLNTRHPITQGRNASEAINVIQSYGGSAVNTNSQFTNILALSSSAINVIHPTGVGPSGAGDSQAIAGNFGLGRLVIFGDSNGFTAMIFNNDDGSQSIAGFTAPNSQWQQMALNTLRWLTKVI
ncbi:hypothetical protein [Paraglaciecola aestuariivivens]